MKVLIIDDTYARTVMAERICNRCSPVEVLFTKIPMPTFTAADFSSFIGTNDPDPSEPKRRQPFKFKDESKPKFSRGKYRKS